MASAADRLELSTMPDATVLSATMSVQWCLKVTFAVDPLSQPVKAKVVSFRQVAG